MAPVGMSIGIIILVIAAGFLVVAAIGVGIFLATRDKDDTSE